MFRLVFILITILGIIHMTLYYLNIDTFKYFEKEKVDLADTKNDLLNCLNELKNLEYN
jgi:hypothetical protein